LSNNQLSGALPGEIRTITNLETLDVSNNRMTGIPAEIGQLGKLRVLNYNNNRLTGLPMELGNLTQLQTLDLSGNPKLSQQDLSGIRANLPNTTIKL
jgi:Leucine-rich repeat (LRR) protein